MPIPAVAMPRAFKIFLAGSAAFAFGSGIAFAQDRPAPLRTLEEQGVTIVGPLPSPGGLKAWAAYSGQHPIALYGTPDGKYVIAGTMLDANGNDVNHDALEKTVAQPMDPGRFRQSAAHRLRFHGPQLSVLQ